MTLRTVSSLSLIHIFPRADQLYPGDLGYSATRILTLFSLLIPAFSLLSTPQLLPVLLLRVKNAPLPLSLIHIFRAGRNLPDKEFRYLRTVIVTAAVYWGFNSKLRLR